MNRLNLDKTKLRGELKENEPLSNYTSWRIGGPVDYLYRPADMADLNLFLSMLPANEVVHWLGLGSNTLVRDGGIRGTVIIIQGLLKELKQLDETRVSAEAGLACGQVARFCARLGLRGLEFFAGIPGTVGGALRMNAGAYGGETWDYVESVEVITRQGKHIIRRPLDYQIGYRYVMSPEEEWFVRVTFKLNPGDVHEAQDYIRTMLAKRNASQPTNLPNGGSVFRNPPGDYAARLIEASGLKGYRSRGACVSEKHANFIVNDEGACAADIEMLIGHVAQVVFEKQSIQLVREVHIIGESKSPFEQSSQA